MNRWQLSDEVKEKNLLLVQEFINKIESSDGTGDLAEINLSDTGLNPYTLEQLMVGLGYEKGDMDTNGWQMDFWLKFRKDGFKTLSMQGTGITFEIKLVEEE